MMTVGTVPAVAGPKVPGIDVSKYQGRIDWRRVASRSPVRFVIMRSTLGNRYVDRRFRSNVAGASRNGLVVGAYHFAKPGPARWDAQAEANHFLSVARNAPGDVLPVLDIEDSGGLSTGQLHRWASRWLRRVHDITGVRAMIYSGNHFWRHSMGNTAWFARRGHPQWVAHWYVPRPEVPGRRWGGRGWTFWQWSASGRIPGIRGDVDRDWFRGKDLSRATIASIHVEPAPGGTISGPMLECGSGADRCSRRDNHGDEVVLRAAADPDARFLRWTGACEHAGTSPRCTLVSRGERRVSALFGFPLDPARSEGETVAGCPECALALLLARVLGAMPRA
jgi:lysozyme